MCLGLLKAQPGPHFCAPGKGPNRVGHSIKEKKIKLENKEKATPQLIVPLCLPDTAGYAEMKVNKWSNERGRQLPNNIGDYQSKATSMSWQRERERNSSSLSPWILPKNNELPKTVSLAMPLGCSISHL